MRLKKINYIINYQGMKKIYFLLIATLMATMVNAEQIQNVTVKLINASKVGFSWFSTNPSTTQFRVEILDADKVLVASMTNEKSYWNYWHAFYDDYTPAENEHYSSTEYILRSTTATKGDSFDKCTFYDGSFGGYGYGLVEGTYFIVVTGLGADNSVTEESATLEVELKKVQEQEDEEGNIQLNVIGLEAAYMTEYVTDKEQPWLIIFYTGVDETSDGLPQVWITVDTKRESAISGTYSKALGNAYIDEDDNQNNCFVNTDGKTEGLVYATDVELNIDFVGFYQPYVAQGYHYGVYSGSFKLVGKNGKTYVASFNQMLCNSFTYETLLLSNSEKDFVGMYDEDLESKIDNVIETSQPAKVLENGHIYILRNGKRYTITGTEVR